MKSIEITLRVDCRDDVPNHVIEWMGDNLAEHASNEFYGDYDPTWNDGYEGPPIADRGRVVVAQMRVAAETEIDDAEQRAIDTLNDTQITTALAEITELRFALSFSLDGAQLNQKGDQVLLIANEYIDEYSSWAEDLRWMDQKP